MREGPGGGGERRTRRVWEIKGKGERMIIMIDGWMIHGMIPHFLSCHVDLTLAIVLSPIEMGLTNAIPLKS